MRHEPNGSGGVALSHSVGEIFFKKKFFYNWQIIYENVLK